MNYAILDGPITICSAIDRRQKIDCQYNPSHNAHCPHMRFEFHCDCIDAQKGARHESASIHMYSQLPGHPSHGNYIHVELGL